MRPGAPLSPGPHPLRIGDPEGACEARRPALAGPHPAGPLGPAGALVRARRPALAGPSSLPARLGRQDPAVRPGAPISPGLTPSGPDDPEGTGVRPGAPLSPGLVSKTRDPRMWLTSPARVSARLVSGPRQAR